MVRDREGRKEKGVALGGSGNFAGIRVLSLFPVQLRTRREEERKKGEGHDAGIK